VDRDLLDLAVRVVDEAGRIAADAFFAGSARRLKADGTEVTDADVAVEDFIRAELARATPDDAVFGEEAGESTGRSGRRWVIDPISGTGYFTRGMPVFANLLAYEDEHGSAIGVINLPIQHEMLFAARGGGCWLRTGAGQRTARQVSVADRADLDGALTLAMNQHTWTDELVLALHRRTALVGGIHHGAFYVATGRVDAVVATHQGYEDLAPLPVIMSEAGAVVTDIDGTPPLTGDGSMIAANPRLHGALVQLLTELPRTRGPKALQ
jgi:histidinol-phosphatase